MKPLLPHLWYPTKMLARINRLVAITALVGAASFGATCSVFTVYDGKLALAGDSEDWIDPNTQVWFVPKGTKTFGVVYFGFGTGEYPPGGLQLRAPKKPLTQGGIIEMDPTDAYGFPQAGMNEEGLFFGGAATDVLSPETRRNGKPPFIGFFADHVLRHCRTVPEALAIIRKYDIGLPQGQLLFGDRFGGSAIVEAGNTIIERSGRFQVITNFRISAVPKDSITCDRFRRLSATLAVDKPLTIDFARDAIASVAVPPVSDSLAKRRPGTQYSVVFDMTHGVAHLYNRAQFDRDVQIDVKKEIAKGSAAKRIGDLFR